MHRCTKGSELCGDAASKESDALRVGDLTDIHTTPRNAASYRPYPSKKLIVSVCPGRALVSLSRSVLCSLRLCAVFPCGRVCIHLPPLHLCVHSLSSCTGMRWHSALECAQRSHQPNGANGAAHPTDHLRRNLQHKSPVAHAKRQRACVHIMDGDLLRIRHVPWDDSSRVRGT